MQECHSELELVANWEGPRRSGTHRLRSHQPTVKWLLLTCLGFSPWLLRPPSPPAPPPPLLGCWGPIHIAGHPEALWPHLGCRSGTLAIEVSDQSTIQVPDQCAHSYNGMNSHVPMHSCTLTHALGSNNKATENGESTSKLSSCPSATWPSRHSPAMSACRWPTWPFYPSHPPPPRHLVSGNHQKHARQL